jgi:membrane protein DedA with SNARE-associated domain
MHELFEWLTSLPPVALYLALALTAALENFFPPLPADTVVAFGSFLAARGEATLLSTYLATWLGNVSGAMGVYALGRHVGADGMRTWLLKYGRARSEERLEQLYRRRGMLALFLSRFLPGVRALVPPFAGALRMPALRVAMVVTIASGLWYGFITLLAYRLGADWEAISARLGVLTRSLGWGAAVVAVAAAAWLIYRRASRRRA